VTRHGGESTRALEVYIKGMERGRRKKKKEGESNWATTTQKKVGPH